ncbi:MAG: sigma-70 family RNA polymerase sigma factor [Chitinophagales bacterium]
MIGVLQADVLRTSQAAEARRVFTELVEKHQKYVYNLAYRMSGNPEEARDLAQEAFIRAYRSFDRFDRATSFEKWLYRIVANLYIDSVRRKGRRKEESLDAPVPTVNGPMERVVPDDAYDPSVVLEQTQLTGEIQAALERLPAQYRMAVILCDLQGFSYEEIASMLRCSIGTVRSRIHRGRRLLREQLETLPAYRRLGGPAERGVRA